jgi:hypothetical protein
MEGSYNGWGSDDSIGTRIARHRAGWSAHQRAMIEQERRAQIEAHDLLMLRGHDPIPGYQVRAGDSLYEPGAGEPLTGRDARLIWTVLALAALCFAGGLAFLVWWLTKGCPWGAA